MLRSLLTVVFLGLTSFAVYAEGISTHVLDLASGVGGKSVPVVLEFKGSDGAWKKIASAQTDENGRIKSFGSSLKAQIGTYRLSFDMTKYPGGSKKPFFPEINVVFQIDNEKLHYHVPVVVSPYGYSTYRGN